MNIWLSRRRNGNYLMTRLRPQKHVVQGLEPAAEDYYVPYGDLIGLDNCCTAGIKALFDVDIPIGEQVRAEVHSGKRA